MKMIEELDLGDCFDLGNNQYFVLTQNFRMRDKHKEHQVVSLKDGSFKWIKADVAISNIGLYTTDSGNNIVSIKEYKDDYKKY
jgi:hypothetical protein